MLIEITAVNPEQLKVILEEIWKLGNVVDRFDAKTINFEPYDNKYHDRVTDLLDLMEVEYRMV